MWVDRDRSIGLEWLRGELTFATPRSPEADLDSIDELHHLEFRFYSRDCMADAYGDVYNWRSS